MFDDGVLGSGSVSRVNYNTEAKIRARIQAINAKIRKVARIKNLVAKERERRNVYLKLVSND